MAETPFLPGSIDQDPAHRLCGGAKKMCAILPLRLIVAAETEPSFVHEGRGLKCLSWRFPCHFLSGQGPQFFIDQRQELMGGMGISFFDALQDGGEAVHTGSNSERAQ